MGDSLSYLDNLLSLFNDIPQYQPLFQARSNPIPRRIPIWSTPVLGDVQE